MPLVLDVVSDGHPLQTALRVFDCSPGLLDLVIKNMDKKEIKPMEIEHWE